MVFSYGVDALVYAKVTPVNETKVPDAFLDSSAPTGWRHTYTHAAGIVKGKKIHGKSQAKQTNKPYVYTVAWEINGASKTTTGLPFRVLTTTAPTAEASVIPRGGGVGGSGAGDGGGVSQQQQRQQPPQQRTTTITSNVRFEELDSEDENALGDGEDEDDGGEEKNDGSTVVCTTASGDSLTWTRAVGWRRPRSGARLLDQLHAVHRHSTQRADTLPILSAVLPVWTLPGRHLRRSPR